MSSNIKKTEKKESKTKTDYYKNPRSDISSFLSHLVRVEKEKHDLEKKNSKYQSTILKLVNILDKSIEKKNNYKRNYRQIIHKTDYLIILSKIMKDSIISHIVKNEYNYDLSDNCSMCLERLDKPDETIMITTCGHLFHKDCILKSISSINNKCPNCRTEFLLVDIGTNVNNKLIPNKNENLYTILNNTLEIIDFNYFLGEDEQDIEEYTSNHSSDSESYSDNEEQYSETSSLSDNDN